MSSTESGLPNLVPVVLSLSQADKLRLMQVLVGDLARDEGIPPIEAGKSYPVWTPIHAFDAAVTMLHELGVSEAVV
jgi:hypothetical protein